MLLSERFHGWGAKVSLPAPRPSEGLQQFREGCHLRGFPYKSVSRDPFSHYWIMVVACCQMAFDNVEEERTLVLYHKRRKAESEVERGKPKRTKFALRC